VNSQANLALLPLVLTHTLPVRTEAAPDAQAKAAAKAVTKGTKKSKVVKKRFSVTFHRCVLSTAMFEAAHSQLGLGLLVFSAVTSTHTTSVSLRLLPR
jgi:Ribosomal protein L23, N-terminal domain